MFVEILKHIIHVQSEFIVDGHILLHNSVDYTTILMPVFSAMEAYTAKAFKDSLFPFDTLFQTEFFDVIFGL